MENKRKVSILAPYFFEEDKMFVFLQKRADDCLRSPGIFGFFGGGLENNETSEEALKREIKEELDYDVKDYTYFNQYEGGAIKNIFFTEVNRDFENQVIILEGDYGKWFSIEEIPNIKISESDKNILKDLYNYLKDNKKI